MLNIYIYLYKIITLLFFTKKLKNTSRPLNEVKKSEKKEDIDIFYVIG